MMNPTLVLGRDCGDALADESDFEAWVSYVNRHIDDACGFLVDVEMRPMRDVQTDQIRGCGGDRREAIGRAKEVLWDRFCVDDSAWPARDAGVEIEWQDGGDETDRGWYWRTPGGTWDILVSGHLTADSDPAAVKRAVETVRASR